MQAYFSCHTLSVSIAEFLKRRNIGERDKLPLKFAQPAEVKVVVALRML